MKQGWILWMGLYLLIGAGSLLKADTTDATPAATPTVKKHHHHAKKDATNLPEMGTVKSDLSSSSDSTNVTATVNGATTMVSMQQSLGSDVFIKTSVGYDYSRLTDIVDGIQTESDEFIEFGGPDAYSNCSKGHSGLALNVDLGIQLDALDALSIGIGSVMSQTDEARGFVYDGFPYTFGESIQPNMADVSLDFSRQIASSSNSKTTLNFGLGWYHAFVNYSENDDEEFGASDAVFTANALGGVFGISEEWSLGGNFNFSAGLQARYVDFIHLTTNSMDIDGETQTEPWTLWMDEEGGIYPGPDENGYDTRVATLDYSGLDGFGSISYNF